jgi:putative SOS response-associated peptidase YedK
MCVNYITVSRQMCFDWFRTPLETGEDWRDEIYQDYNAPFIVHDAQGRRRGLLGSYGFIPKRHLPPGQRLTTMNARAETVGQLRNYKQAWASSQLCLVPCLSVFEPNWEQPQHVRWAIEMADKAPFAVAGIWRSWDEQDGSQSHSFTQLTVNADEHPLMRRFHKPDDEKRSVVIIRPEDYDEWLGCKNPELARTFLQLYPADRMAAHAAPRVVVKSQAELF